MWELQLSQKWNFSECLCIEKSTDIPGSKATHCDILRKTVEKVGLCYEGWDTLSILIKN